MAQTTAQQYAAISLKCRNLFIAKMADYGVSWRILRPSSLTDQLLIKARRIRSIQDSGSQRVEDGIDQDFMGLVNYGIMAILQIRLPTTIDGTSEDPADILGSYDGVSAEIRDLMERKNHDYGEVWRDMRVSSMTDLILMKLLRIKQIEDKDGVTMVSEGLEANYSDIVNYAIFCLIKLTLETKNTP